MDRPETSTVAGSHVLVQSLDGLSAGHLTVLLVHVVGAGARVVTDPDTEVLDLLGALLEDLSRSVTVHRRSVGSYRLYAPGSRTRSHRWPS